MTEWYEKDKLPIVFPEAKKEDETIIYYNPIFTAEDFIAYTKDHSQDFINYCEAVIAENGNIILARPSHTAVLHSIVREIKKGTNFEFTVMGYFDELQSIANCIWVWYVQQEALSKHALTKSQKKTLGKLVAAGLIKDNLKYLS